MQGKYPLKQRSNSEIKSKHTQTVQTLLYTHQLVDSFSSLLPKLK